MENSVCSFMRTRFKGKFVPPHSHNNYEFVYFFNGSGVFGYGGKEYYFTKGSYYLMKPFESHYESYDNTGQSLVLSFIPGEEVLKPENLFSNDNANPIGSVCELIREELKSSMPFSDYAIDGLVSLLLAKIVRPIHIKKDMVNDGIRKSMNYLDQYFMTDIKIAELAGDCGYCADHFRFLFKSKTGLTPKQYVLSKRIKLSKKLLKETDFSLNDIYKRCGFKSYSQFAVFFKERVKMTPMEYRNKVRNVR